MGVWGMNDSENSTEEEFGTCRLGKRKRRGGWCVC